jgi:hypothetical protein
LKISDFGLLGKIISPKGHERPKKPNPEIARIGVLLVTRSGALTLVFAIAVTVVVAILAYSWYYSITMEPPQCIEACDEPRAGEDLLPPPRTRSGEAFSFAVILSIIVFILSGLLGGYLFHWPPKGYHVDNRRYAPREYYQDPDYQYYLDQLSGSGSVESYDSNESCDYDDENDYE